MGLPALLKYLWKAISEADTVRSVVEVLGIWKYIGPAVGAVLGVIWSWVHDAPLWAFPLFVVGGAAIVALVIWVPVAGTQAWRRRRGRTLAPPETQDFPDVAIRVGEGYVDRMYYEVKHPGDTLGLRDIRPGHWFFVIPAIQITNRSSELISLSAILNVDVDRQGFVRSTTLEQPNVGGFRHPDVSGQARLLFPVNIPPRETTPTSFLTFWLSKEPLTGISSQSSIEWTLARAALVFTEHNSDATRSVDVAIRDG